MTTNIYAEPGQRGAANLHHAAATALGRREQEARRIARAEGFPIIEHDADWTFFTIDDPLYDATMGRTIRTHFSWVRESGRFEGFVS